MKNAIILFFVLSIFFCHGQNTNCFNTDEYNFIIKDLKLIEKKKYFEVKIGHMPNAFTLGSILETSNFNETESFKIESTSNKLEYIVCDSLQKVVENLTKDRTLINNEPFIVYHLSKTINISKLKKGIIVTLTINSKKYNSGKSIGDEILYLFEKKDGNWQLYLKKVI